MSKRFTCSEKWHKLWFRKLSPENKLFWFYICDSCNHAGIWNVDFEIASIYIGKKITFQNIIKSFGNKLYFFDNDTKCFIPSFIEFQYGELNPKNRLHYSVIKLLERNNLYNILEDIKEGANKPLVSPLLGAKDKDKEKDKEIKISKESDNPKKKYHDWVYLTDDEYKTLIFRFGKSQTDSQIENLDSWLSNKRSERDKSDRNDYKRLISFFKNSGNTGQQKTFNPKETKNNNELIELISKPIEVIADYLLGTGDAPKGFKQSFITKYGDIKGIEKYNAVLKKEEELRKGFKITSLIRK